MKRQNKMKLDAIMFNSVFEYVRDIRRYIYDIEDDFRKKGMIDYVEAPSIPDDVDSYISRLTIIKTIKNITYTFAFSQKTYTITATYPIKDKSLNDFRDEMIDLTTHNHFVYDLLIKTIPNFRINYETLGATFSKLYKDYRDINKKQLYGVNLIEKADEKRSRYIFEVDNSWLVTSEYAAIKTYSLSGDIREETPRNTMSNFKGWTLTGLKEISNRLIYNNSSDEVSNRLDLAMATYTIEEEFKHDNEPKQRKQ